MRVGFAAQIELIEINDPFTDRFCDLDGEECADEVEDRRQCDCDFWCESAGGNGRRHCVCGVVKTICEVERERGSDHYDEDDQFGHSESILPGLCSSQTVAAPLRFR